MEGQLLARETRKKKLQQKRDELTKVRQKALDMNLPANPRGRGANGGLVWRCCANQSPLTTQIHPLSRTAF
jgi:hypothetical protein